MKTAIRTLALAGIVGFAMLAGNVSTAKAGPYWNRPGYRHYYPGYRAYAYPYAYTPYAYAYPDYSAGYYPGYYGYASAREPIPSSLTNLGPGNWRSMKSRESNPCPVLSQP